MGCGRDEPRGTVAWGAFRAPNDGDRCAALYREEMKKRVGEFAVIVFAIFSAGYGQDNYSLFHAESTPRN